MPLTIPVAHDFICPWCWVALFQVRRLREEFGVEIGWRGYELFPDALEWPDYPAQPELPADKPPVPSRLDFILVADGLEMPAIAKPHKMRTHRAHEALEYAKTEGKADAFAEILYRAYWERGREINRPDVLRQLAEDALDDVEAMTEAIEDRRFAADIVPFDDEAYASGVYNVPTYWIGGERYAEQPYAVLRKAVERAL